MPKPTSVVISMSVALLLALFSAEIGKSVVAVRTVQASLLNVESDSSTSLSPTPQNASFVWVLPNEEGDYPGYRRVVGGALNNGTKLYICRAGYTPGKVYNDLCLYPYGGGESIFRLGYYEVLLTNAKYQWKAADEVSRADISSGAVKGGSDRDNTDTLYICRKKRDDGVHPGKYSWKNRLCYIPWGGKEYPFKGSFEILFRN